MSKIIRRAKEGFEAELGGIIGKKELESFKVFAFKDQLLKMAAAFILGAAFNKVVTGISEALLMPVINFLLSWTEADWRHFIYTPIPGMTFEIGKLCGSFIDFVFTAIILYVICQKIFFGKQKITCIEGKSCPHCKSTIHWLSNRCPQCTTWLKETNE
jgi:large conductance mechanosensitive channel